eukprot:gene17829-17671_t
MRILLVEDNRDILANLADYLGLKGYTGGGRRELQVGDLSYDLDTLEVTREGRLLKLNPVGLKLLAVLMQKSPHVLRRYDGAVDEVPDPYYDGEQGFEQVLDLIEAACDLLPQVSLKAFNSFGIDVRAQWFAEAHSDADVREGLAYAAAQQLPLLVIGGGSNLLLTQDIPALVLRMATQGIRVLHDDGQQVVVEAEAGEAWHPFVLWTLAQGFSGLENLSLIPGTVGAAPMQNIGAYGVEIKDVFAGLTALDRQTGELRDFSLEECNFAYRDSLFKHEVGRWLILRVRFALNRVAHLKLGYGPVQQRLAEQ